MPAEINRELAATVLIEAAYTTDEKACQKYGVSIRSLQRWRKSLASDPVLAGFVATKKEAVDKAWAESLPVAMKEATQTIASIAAAIRVHPQMKDSPLALEKLAGALKLCADVYYTGRIIDARLAGQNRPPDGLFGADAADAENARPN